MSVYKDKGEPLRLADAFAYRRAFRFWRATAKGHKAAYEAMRQRAEEAEAHLREIESFVAENDPRHLAHAAGILRDVAVKCKRGLSPVPTDALESYEVEASTDPYSGELGSINLRNLAARMHAALGLLKRQGCYHPAMDSMREEGFRHGLNIGDRESEDHIGDATKMVGEKCHPYGYCPICGAPGVMRERRPNGDDRCANGHTYPSKDAVMEQKP